MKLDSADAEGFVVGDLGDLVVGDLRTIDDRDRTASKNLETALSVEDYRGVLVYADAEVISIVRNCRNKTADTAAFREVLVDDDVLQETETGR